MSLFTITLGLEPLVQLGADGIRSLAVKSRNELTGWRERRFKDKLIKAINIIMTEALPGETAMHSPTSHGWPELVVPYIQQVAVDHTKSVEFCQTVAERNIQSFYDGKLSTIESRKIIPTIIRYHSDPHRTLAFGKIATEQLNGKPLLGGDFMTKEYEPGWMFIDYEGASYLDSTTVVHTPQRAEHGFMLRFSGPVKAVAVRNTLEGVLVLICADESRFVELCGCAICSRTNEGLSLDWGLLFKCLASLGFKRAMYVLAMFLELQAREETTRFMWSDLSKELDFAVRMVELEAIRLGSNREYLHAPRAQDQCDITLSLSQFRALVGSMEDEKSKVEEELRLKYINWDRHTGRQDENVLMRSEDWGLASISKALAVLDNALESISSLEPRDKRFAYVRSGAELLPEIRFANMLRQYNSDSELVLHSGLESSLSKKHVTVLSGKDAGCLYRFGMDAAIVYIKEGELSPASTMSKQTFTNFIPIHPIKRQAAVISLASNELKPRERQRMTAWVKKSALNVLGIVDEFADTISECLQKRERNSISAIRQSVSQWAASDIEKAGLEREVLDVMLRMGFRDDGQVVGLSCYYDAVNEIEIFSRRAGATLTLDQPVWLDGLGAVQTSENEWAVISDHKKKAILIDRRDVELNLIPETVSSTGFAVLSPIGRPRADIHLITHNSLKVTRSNLFRNDMRLVAGNACRTGTIYRLCGGK